MNRASVIYFPSTDMVAVEKLLLSWRDRFSEMGVLALFPEQEKHAVSSLQGLCNQHGIPLCGGIFPQLVYNTSFQPKGMCLLRFDTMPYATMVTSVLPDPASATNTAQAITTDITRHLTDDTPATLFLLLDGMLPNISSLLDELYLRLANRVHYAGVNAGSESFRPMPCLFDNQRIVGDAVLAILLKPHHGAIVEHGYQCETHSLPATSTDGNRIINIDWRPAFEVYQELVLARFNVAITRDNFYEYAVHFPFGILRANHSTLVRIPVMIDDENALYCIGEVPAHSMLTLMDAPQVDSATTLATLQQGLTQLNGSLADQSLLLFYCAGRRLHVGDAGASEELRLFGQMSQAACVAGGLALGEIGETTLRGYPLFHNATLVATVWPNCHEVR